MTEFWDERYADPEYLYGKQPNKFLASQWQRIPKGRVLCLAEGEGRNAVFLALHGYAVTAVDQSAKGLEKVRSLARENGVEVETIVANLADFPVEPDTWDGVVSIFVHVPPKIRKPLHEQIVRNLKLGGIFLLEAYTEKQLEMSGNGGPPPSQRDSFMSQADLESELSGLEFLVSRETEEVLQEGKLHNGLSALVQLIATRLEN